MFALFFQTSIWEIPAYIAAILTALGVIAGVIVTAIYFRSGLVEKKAEGYKALYEMEKEKAANLEKTAKEWETKHKQIEGEKDSLSREYTALSQLFAKKSIILEFVTGYNGKFIKLIDNGQFEIIESKPAPPNRELLTKGVENDKK